MTEAELRQWVDANPGRANPGRVNDWDNYGYTPLYTPTPHGITPSYAAVYLLKSLPLVLWLLDEKGVDVNSRTSYGQTPLHAAGSLDVLSALLDRGADPTLLDTQNQTPLIPVAYYQRVDIVARLLQDPRVRATIDVQVSEGNTALHFACCRKDVETFDISIVHFLLQFGADHALVANDGMTPLSLLLRYTAAITLLEEVPEAEKTSFIVKARRLVVTTNSSITPPYLQGRVARGQPLPRVKHRRVVLPRKARCGHYDDGEGSRKLRATLDFLVGLEGGPEGEGMPRDVF